MKKLYITLVLAAGFSMIATILFLKVKSEAKASLQFRSLYHQVQLFIGNEGDYYNKVTYPQSAPEIEYDDFFIEIVHQGQVESPFWAKWPIYNKLVEADSDYFSQKVVFISITSDRSFLNYNPGDNLADLFLVEKKESLFLENHRQENLLMNVKDIHLKDFSSFLYTLSKAPSQSGVYQFTFNYVLSDGNKLSATSRQLNIKGES